MSCPHGHEAAKFVNYRPKTFVSLLGEIRLERAYYHCSHCHAGFVPCDQTLRFSTDTLTPGAREVTCLVGILSRFAEGRVASLPKLTGLHLSESTVERTTEAVGRDVGARLASGEGFGTTRDWDWHEAEGKTCAYVSLDATGVCQQGPDGAKAEGRMVTVAMVYNPVPEVKQRRAHPDHSAPRFHVRYVAGFDGIASLGNRSAAKRRRSGWTEPSAGSRSATAGPAWKIGYT